jgi:hypothetical protein
MSLNPNAYTDDRRATRFRVALRSWVAESPASCDRVRTDYTWKSPLVKHAVECGISARPFAASGVLGEPRHAPDKEPRSQSDLPQIQANPAGHAG